MIAFKHEIKKNVAVVLRIRGSREVRFLSLSKTYVSGLSSWQRCFRLFPTAVFPTSAVFF